MNLHTYSQENGKKYKAKSVRAQAVFDRIEFYEDEDKYLLALALERKKNDNGGRWSFEEILAEDGLTLEAIDKMLEEEDVEIE